MVFHDLVLLNRLAQLINGPSNYLYVLYKISGNI